MKGHGPKERKWSHELCRQSLPRGKENSRHARGEHDPQIRRERRHRRVVRNQTQGGSQRRRKRWQSASGRSRRAAGRPCNDALHANIFKSSSTQLHSNQAYLSRDNRTFADSRSQNKSQPTQIICPKAHDIDTETDNHDINAIDDGRTAPDMLQKAVKRRRGSAKTPTHDQASSHLAVSQACGAR